MGVLVAVVASTGLRNSSEKTRGTTMPKVGTFTFTKLHNDLQFITQLTISVVSFGQLIQTTSTATCAIALVGKVGNLQWSINSETKKCHQKGRMRTAHLHRKVMDPHGRKSQGNIVVKIPSPIKGAHPHTG